MKYLINANAVTTEDVDVQLVALVTFDRTDKESMIRRRAMFDALKKYDSQLYSLTFYDAPCIYDVAAFPPPLDDLNSTFEYIPIGLQRLPDVEERVEACCCEVDEDGVHWSFYRKHSPIRWETARLSWEALDA